MFLRPNIILQIIKLKKKKHHSEGYRDINQIMGGFAAMGLVGKEKKIGWETDIGGGRVSDRLN